MLIFDIFITTYRQAKLEYITQDALTLLSTSSFNQLDLQHALSKKQAYYRQLFYDLPHSDYMQAQTEYSLFLEKCSSALGTKNNAYFLPVVINYFSDKNDIEKCCELFNYNFRDQKIARALAPLGRMFIPNPASFAAFLTWLMQRGTNVADILSTYILHDYALYYLVDNDDTYDPRQFLYKVLIDNTDTRELGLAMSVTACSKNELSYFALNGRICTTNNLNIVEKTQIHDVITDDANNINALERLFGINLVIYALHSSSSLSSLKNLINNNLPDLIRRIEENSKTVIDLISTYTLILQFLVANNCEHTNFIFKSIIKILLDAVIQYPCVLDDYLLFDTLYSFKDTSQLIPEYAKLVEDEFVNICEMEVFNFINIEDNWKKASIKLAALREILPYLKTNLPKNIYNLYAYLAKIKIRKIGVWFNLRDFITTLNIVPEYGMDSVSIYERLLIELLVTIDSEFLRKEIIAELKLVIHPPRNFMQTNYTDFSLMQQAIYNGNLGMVTYLHKNNFKVSKDEIKEYTNIAAQNTDWEIVLYLYKNFTLPQDMVNNLLQQIISHKAADVIHHLFQEGKLHPSLRTIEKEFLNASAQADVASAQALLHCPTPPCITIIIKAFNQALEVNPPLFNVVKLIVKHKMEDDLFREAVRLSFLSAAKRKNSIKTISLLKNNPAINQKTVDAAFIGAIRAGQSENAICIRTFGIIKPSTNSINKACKKPGKSNLEELEALLPNLTIPSTNIRKKTNYKSNLLSKNNDLPILPLINNSIANLAKLSYFEHAVDNFAPQNGLDSTKIPMPKLFRNSSC